MSLPEPLSRLIEQLQKLPGIGAKSAQRLAGRRIAVNALQTAPAQEPPAAATQQEDAAPAAPAKRDLKAEAMSSSAVQAMLDVFPAQIRDVEEM